MNIDVSSLRGEKIYNVSNICSYVVMDIETTGLSYQDDIIELAAIKVDNDVIIDTFQTLIKPIKCIPTNITEITGINDNMVKDAPAFPEIVSKIVSFIGKNIIIGHNVIFDLDRLNNKLYSISNQCICNDYIDTMSLARERIAALKSFSLLNVSNYLNINIDISHRALDDCYTTLKCYNVLKNLPVLDYDEIYQKEKCSPLSKMKNVANFQASADHPLYNKTVVITGSLCTVSRNEACELIKSVGGLLGNTVTKKTNYLVTNSDVRTGKLKKALQYIEAGIKIEIISEKDFFNLLNS